MTGTKRILTIDAMRFIGISCVILAHVLGPGSLLFQIRSFDVPLMVFVSGLVSARKKIPGYVSFVGRRALRLMVPVWLFYAFYFVLFFFFSKMIPGIEIPDQAEIVRSFLCLEGYGWIIRVFVLITLIAPLLIRLEQLLKNSASYLAVILGLLVLSAVCTPMFDGQDCWIVKDLWQGCILFLLGYTPAFMAGLRMRNAGWKEQLLYIGVFTLGTVVYFLRPGVSFDLEYFKWPPQYPFMLYGIAISCLIWRCQPLLKALSHIRPIVFIGQNTIWIYLWHVLALAFVFNITDIWPVQYCIVFGFSISVFLIQYQLVKNKPKTSFAHKYLIG